MANAVFLHALDTLSWLGGRQDSHLEHVENHFDNGDCLLTRGFCVFPRGLMILLDTQNKECGIRVRAVFVSKILHFRSHM